MPEVEDGATHTLGRRLSNGGDIGLDAGQRTALRRYLQGPRHGNGGKYATVRASLREAAIKAAEELEQEAARLRQWVARQQQ
jgi:hypothetical protein